MATKKRKKRKKRGELNDDNMHTSNTLERIPTISISRHQSELYYQWILLHHHNGATSYEDLRKVGDDECENFQAACVRLSLLEDNSEKDNTMEKASLIKFGSQLRDVLATILLHCTPAQPLAFWLTWHKALAHDLMHQQGVHEITELIEHIVLLHLQERVECKGIDLHHNFGLPQPDPNIVEQAQVQEFSEKRQTLM